MQERTLGQLFGKERLHRVQVNEALNMQNAYSQAELLDDLTRSIFQEISTKRPVDLYRRNLQRVYIDQLNTLLNSTEKELMASDINSLTRANFKFMDKTLSAYQTSDSASGHHRDGLRARISAILDPK